jgi:hypothetical protein
MALQPPGRLLSSRRQTSSRRPPDPPGPPGRRGRRIPSGSQRSLPGESRSDAGRSLSRRLGGACRSPPTKRWGLQAPSQGHSANHRRVVTTSPPPALTPICVISGVRTSISWAPTHPIPPPPNCRRLTRIPTWPTPLRPILFFMKHHLYLLIPGLAQSVRVPWRLGKTRGSEV